MDDLKALSNYLPGIMLWKKDTNSVFLDMNDLLATTLGFKNPEAAQGLTDYEIPSAAVECAEIYRQQDNQVILSGRILKALEIVTSADSERLILLTYKRPCYENDKIMGIAGYTVDITQAFLQLNTMLLEQQKLLYTPFQGSFAIGLERTCNLDLQSIEAEALFLLVRGHTITDMAKMLNLSGQRVEQYLDQLKKKFRCNSNSELITSAIGQGFLNNIPEHMFNAGLSAKMFEKIACMSKKAKEDIEISE